MNNYKHVGIEITADRVSELIGMDYVGSDLLYIAEIIYADGGITNVEYVPCNFAANKFDKNLILKELDRQLESKTLKK